MCSLLFLVLQIITVSAADLSVYPNFSLQSSDCYMQEKIKITVNNSNCQFLITDLNGHLNNVKTIILDSESQLFEFQYKQEPLETDQATTISLVLKNDITLNYENQTNYDLDVNFTDSFRESINANFTVFVFQPPQWNDFPPTNITINETQIWNFTLSTSKGNGHPTGNISYKLEDPSRLIELKENVLSIDTTSRKFCNWSVINLGIVAYYIDEPSAEISGQMTIRFDNPPTIQSSINEFSIDKNSQVFVKTFQIMDMDLLCDYSKYLVTVKVPQKYENAFEIFPQNGTKFMDFNLTVYPQYLDFNDFYFHIEIEAVSATDANIFSNFPITVRLNSGSSVYLISHFVLILVVFISFFIK